MISLKRIALVTLNVLLLTDVLFAQKRKNGRAKDAWAELIEVVHNTNKADFSTSFKSVHTQNIGNVVDTVEAMNFKTVFLGSTRYLSAGEIEQIVDDSMLVLINNDRKQVVASKAYNRVQSSRSPLDFLSSDSLLKALKSDWQIESQVHKGDTSEITIVKLKKSVSQEEEQVLRITYLKAKKQLLSIAQERTGYIILNDENVEDIRRDFGSQYIVKIGELLAIKKVQLKQIQIISHERIEQNGEAFKTSFVLDTSSFQIKLREPFSKYELIIID